MLQMEREIVLHAFAEIEQEVWQEWFTTHKSEDVPQEIVEEIANFFGCMFAPAELEIITMLKTGEVVKAKEIFLSNLAMLSDDWLLWLVTSVSGKSPLATNEELFELLDSNPWNKKVNEDCGGCSNGECCGSCFCCPKE